ncbi:MAG: ORF6N domain-containing protein [Rickettsiales bacterium]
MAVVPSIDGLIRSFRGQRVMLDADLAKLYGVATKVLIQAVKRNRERFPDDFMFQLTNQEVAKDRSQIVTTSAQVTQIKQKSRRGAAPYAFTEQGVAMLSSVLNSSQAIAINLEIMRSFVRVRALAIHNSDFAKRLDVLEQKAEALSSKHDHFSEDTKRHLNQLFAAMRELMEPPPIPAKHPIGFVVKRKPDPAKKKISS